MDEIWIEVDIAQDNNSVAMFDWTFYMRDWFVDNHRTYIEYSKKFVAVRGKYLTINVMGLGANYERCKSFAIWYITNRDVVSTHGLDSIYSERIRRAWRGKRSSPNG